MRPGGSSFHGANLTPEATQYVGHVMGNSGVEGHSDGHHLMVEAASPISSRPPALQVTFDESAPAVAIAGVPNEDDSLVREEGERGAASANRWPRPETLTLLKIRSDMDADFREATLKGPLWEDVSRKMSEMGYNRSAKKCKEKFENVHKYYKRTKEGRARRQDGKSYRFFTELEALHATVTTTTSVTTTIQGLNYALPTATILPPPPLTVTHINSNQATSCNNAFVAPTTGNSTMLQSQRSNATPIISNQPIRPPVASTKRASADVSVQETSLSLGGSSDSGKSSEETHGDNHPKRIKPSNLSGLNTNEMMDFFRDLMKRVVEEQVRMQQRLLEDAEKREEDRMVREEAWRRHEMGRLSRELDILAQESALSASRDAAMISLLQKFTGAATAFPLPSPPPPPTVQLLLTPSPKTAGAIPIVPMAEEATPPRKQPNNHQKEQPPEQPQDPVHTVEAIRPIRNQACTNVAVPEKSLTDFDPASSRWPKVEVLALIKLRSGLESRYQEAGPKGPLWEEISAEMSTMGYRRSSKRCKEKWENINKYFRKMKESNKTRQEDAKTCPYFHELEALHKKKMLGGTLAKPEPDPPELIPQPERLVCDRMKIMPIPVSVPAVVPANSMAEAGGMELGVGNNGGSDQMQIRSSTGFESSNGEEGNVVAAEKAVDIVRDLMEKRPQRQAVMDDYAKMEDPDEDANSVEDDFEDDEHDCYEARYRNQNGPAMARGSNSFVTMIR